MATRNPKDSMKSTWRTGDKSTWKFYHHAMLHIDPFYEKPNDPTPVFSKDDPIPVLSKWSCNLFICLHAAWPMALQLLFYAAFGRSTHPITTVLLYTIAWMVNALHEINMLYKVGRKTGYLDGEKPRDDVPDVAVGKTLASLILTTTIRPIFTTYLTYNRYEMPSLSPWLPVELFMYSIVLDFWFYVYHRACHEVEFLWRYHRTHHLTKHPNPFLSAYSDSEQEAIEMAIVPLLTYGVLKLMGFPMGFYDWWVCHEYLIFSEAFGHSGLRVVASTPGISSPILSLFGCELLIEDHDLHHRKGWRKSANYGKQTRLWDRIFGTCGERIECHQVDYKRTVDLPLW